MDGGFSFFSWRKTCRERKLAKNVQTRAIGIKICVIDEKHALGVFDVETKMVGRKRW